jgi:hypothetical protein
MSQPLVAAGATYQSAERVLSLLASFEDGRPELSVSEIAASLGVHKSTASRLAATLERTGFLARSGRRYRLGVEVIRLGTLALRSTDIVATMQPAMEKLSQLTGETINLAIPAGPDILNVAEVPSTYILSSSGGWIGRRTKPHAVANGKVLLAFGAIPAPATLGAVHHHHRGGAAGGAGRRPPRRLRHGSGGAGRWPGRRGRAGAAPGRQLRSRPVHFRARLPDATGEAGRPGPPVRRLLTAGA